MAKTRLTKYHRSYLNGLVSRIVDCPDLRAVLDAKYEIAAPLVRAIVEATFPPRDMKVCKRYAVAFIDDCIKLRFPGENIEMFNFAAETGPLVTKKTYNGQIYDAGPNDASAVEDWVLARDILKAANDEKRKDYSALIAASRTFEDVIEIWPEAEELRDTICPKNTALTALGNGAIARIKADVASRAAE